MKTRHLVLAAGLAIAAWLAFLGDNAPANGIAEPVARTSGGRVPPTAPANAAVRQPARVASRGAAIEREPFILALQARENLIGGDRQDTAAGLFNSQSWTPPPPPPAKPPPPPPPSAPPLPFSYIGKKMEDATWEVYLARGEQIFIVREQTVVDGTYRVDSIKPPHLSLTYLPLNQMQTLTIGGTD